MKRLRAKRCSGYHKEPLCVRVLLTATLDYVMLPYRTLSHLPYMEAIVQGLRLTHTTYKRMGVGRSFAALRAAHMLLIHTHVGHCLECLRTSFYLLLHLGNVSIVIACGVWIMRWFWRWYSALSSYSILCGSACTGGPLHSPSMYMKS